MTRSVSNHFGVTGRWLYMWLLVTNAAAMLLFGYDQGVFGGILTLGKFETRFQLEDNETLKGVIVGSYDLGCLVGALATGPIGNCIGRKRSILLGTTIMTIGACLQFLASDFGIMTAGRVVAGIGNGMNTATAPVWISETSKTAFRGQAGMALMVINIGGLMISCWMTYLFSFVTSELAWRFPLAFQLFFVLIIFLTAFWLPESPRWLAMKHQDDKGLAVMFALEGRGVISENSTARQDYEEIKTSIALERSPVARRGSRPLFRLFLGVAVQAQQQLTGINIICYYLAYVITESVRLSGSMARLLAGVDATTYLFSTFIGLYFIERWGRRRLLIHGALGQSCCWLAIALILRSASGVDVAVIRQRQLGSAAVVFFFLFNAFFGASWQGVSWLYPTEINSTQNRIAGMAYGVATNWLINFGVVFVTPKGIQVLGWIYYLIFAILNVIIALIVYLLYPETSGRSLEDVTAMFEASPTILAFRNKGMTCRKPSNPSVGQESGDNTADPRAGEGVKTLSRNVSGVELAPLGKVRHRQLGGISMPLGSMTPLHNEVTVGEDEMAGEPTGRAGREVGSEAEDVEEDEDAEVISLQLAQGPTVLSGPGSNLALQVSSPRSSRVFL